MEPDSPRNRARTVLVIAMLLLSPMLIVVSFAPTAAAAVTPGTTRDLVPASSPYIRDDSTAYPIWGFGATDGGGGNSLQWIYIWFDMSGTGLHTGELKSLNTDSRYSGVGLYRDDGTTDDVLDATDSSVSLTSINWFNPWPWNDYYVRMNLNDPVPNAASGSYEWFIVIRTDTDIDDGDTIRTWIDANDIRFNDGTTQPGTQVTGRSIYARETRYYDVGSGGISPSDEEAAFGLRIVDGGSGEQFDYLRFYFQNGGGFSSSDLAPITTTASSSGLAIYRNDGTSSSSWDGSDTAINPTAVSISWPYVYLYISENLPNTPASYYNYWIVVRTSATISHGDTFSILADTSSIRIDGVPNDPWDQNVYTPESGNYDSITYTADTVAPNIYYTDWSESSMYLHEIGNDLYFSSQMTWSQSATLRVGASDSGSGIYRVYFSYESSLGSGGSYDYSSPYEYTYSIDASDSDTSAPVQVTAYDYAGYTDTTTVRYIEDNTAPSVTITNPVALDTLSGTVTITATASDSGARVDTTSAMVSWDGWSWYTMIWDGSRFNYDWDTTVLADGDYRVIVRLYDNVYNLGSSHVNVKLDNTGPASTIVSPHNGEYVHSADDLYVYAVASDMTGVASMEAQLGSGGWVAMTWDAAYSVWWANLGVPGPGNLNVQVRATDTEGNLGPTATVVCIGDANDPTVSISSHSSGDEVSGTVTIRVSAADAERLASVKVYLIGTISYALDAVLNPATGYFEVTVDTTSLPDGSWSVVAQAVDQAGRYTNTAAITITVDNAEPSLAIVTPTNGQYLYGTYSVQASVSDSGSGLDLGMVAMSVDGGTWVAMTLAGSVWTADLDTTALSNGAHTLTVAASDDAGNIAFRAITVYVDNTQPSVAVVAPSASDYVGGSYTFAVSAVDNMGLSNVSAVITTPTTTIDVALGFNAASGYYEWTTDTTGWADGTYSIKPYATELSGRAFTTAATVAFWVDNNAPLLSISAPTDGAVILSSSLLVTVTATDGPFSLLSSQVLYRVDAGAWTQMSSAGGGTWTDAWDTTGVVDGTHSLHFRVTDAAGHVTADSIYVTVDNNDPTCMVAVPTGGQFLEGEVTFGIKADDSLGVSRVDLTFTGVSGVGTVAGTYNPSTGYWEFVMDTTTVTDAAGSVSAMAYDTSGRTAGASAVSFTIDNNAPTLVVGAPGDGDVILSATYDVSVQADDITFGLQPGEVEWRVDNNPWSDMQAGSTAWTVSWFTSDYADGEHTLHFRATDDAGHVTEEAVTVTVDNHDPTVALNTPSVGEYVGGVYTFSARAADLLGVSTVELHFGFNGPAPLDWANATYDPSSGYWELTVDTATLPDGAASLVLVATDASGRVTTTGSHAFYVDNNAPELTLVSPLPGDVVIEEELDIEVVASDEGFALATGDVQYNLDGSGWMDMTNLQGEADRWGFTWNTTHVADGTHMLTFRVTDGAGRVTEAAATFMVDNTDPTCQVVAPALGEFAMGVYRFRVAAADALGISGVELTFHDIAGLTTAGTTYNPASGHWEFLIDTSTLTDATGAVSAVATDASGRVSTVAGPVNFTIDNHDPVVAFVSPSEGAIILEGQQTVTVSAVDQSFELDHGDVHLSLDSGGWVALTREASGEFTWDWNTSAASDGSHNLRVMAEDSAGHASEASINVVVDNHDPALAVVAPTGGQFVTGVLNFQVTAHDTRGIVEVTLQWADGAPVMATVNAGSNYYEYRLDTTTLEDGTYALNATALDGSGRTSRVTVTFHVDNHEPELTFDGPLTGEVLDGEVTVTAGAKDAFVDSLQFSVDGIGWVDMADGEGTFDSNLFADGTHTIFVRAVDGSGKDTMASSTVTFDNNAPDVSIADFPSMAEHVTGQVTFQLFAADVVGVEDVSVLVGDETMPVYLNPTTGFYEWALDTAAHEDGELELAFTASDAAGHNTSLHWTVVVDNSAPVVSSLSPKDGETVEGTVRFEAVVEDETGVDSVLLRIGDRPWMAMTDQGDGTYVHEWETSSKDDADDLSWSVKVTDDLGNAEETGYGLVVDNPGNLTFVALIVILVVLGVIVFMLMRRGGAMGSEDDEDLVYEESEVTAELDALAGIEEPEDVELNGWEAEPDIEADEEKE